MNKRLGFILSEGNLEWKIEIVFIIIYKMDCAYKICKEVIDYHIEEVKECGSILWIEELLEILSKVSTLDVPYHISAELTPYIIILYDKCRSISEQIPNKDIPVFKQTVCKSCSRPYIYLKQLSAYLFTGFHTTAEKLAVVSVLVSSCVHHSCEYHISKFMKISPIITSGLHHLDSIALKNAVYSDSNLHKHLNPILINHLQTKRYILHQEFLKKQKDLDTELQLFKSFLQDLDTPAIKTPQPVQISTSQDVVIVYGQSVTSIPLQVKCTVSSGTIYKTIRIPSLKLKRKRLDLFPFSQVSVQNSQTQESE